MLGLHAQSPMGNLFCPQLLTLPMLLIERNETFCELFKLTAGASYLYSSFRRCAFPRSLTRTDENS